MSTAGSLPRAVWLLDTRRPTSTATMARRRAWLLRDRLSSTLLSLGTTRARPSSVAALAIDSAAGARAFEAADIVVTTSTRGLVHASEHRGPGTRLVHLVHQPPSWVLGNEEFMSHVNQATWLALPLGSDVDDVAAATGFPTGRVLLHGDFTVPCETLPATGAARVVAATGQLTHSSGLLPLLDGFALAAPHLPGWQLRIYATGRLAQTLTERVAELDLGDRVAWFRHGGNLAGAHASAGLAARLSSEEASGLPVMDALAAGLPVLGSVGVPAVRRFVEDGRNGIVLERTDPDTIATALVRFADDRFRAESARQAARLPCGAQDGEGSARLRRIADLVIATEPG